MELYADEFSILNQIYRKTSKIQDNKMPVLNLFQITKNRLTQLKDLYLQSKSEHFDFRQQIA